MTKKAATILLLMVINVSTNHNDNAYIDFVGYDRQIPIFSSGKCEDKQGCFSDSVMYKYISGRLMKLDWFAPTGTKLLLVRDSIYVFRESVDSQLIRYHFKLDGGKTITYWDARSNASPIAAMNDNFFFIVGKSNRSGVSTIYRVNYRTLTTIDTFKINEFYPVLLGADNNYLYFVDQDPDETGPEGSLYRMDIKTGITEMIIWNTSNATEYMAMAVSLNLIYVYGAVVDYNKNLYAISPDRASSVDIGIFYSYEDRAFILSNGEMDINKWRIRYLDDIHEWISYSERMPSFALGNKMTGPWAVPFIKQCIKDQCATAVEYIYRERTGCTDFFGLSGNQMFDHLIKLSKEPYATFKEVEINETYTLASDGHLIIAAHKDHKEHGHITIIISGKSKTQEYWQKDQDNYGNIYLPLVMDIGPQKTIKKQSISKSYEPRRQKDIRFFVYTGEGCKKQ